MPSTTASEPHLSAELLYDFVEGRLSRARRKRAEEHLDRCPECVESLALVLKSDRPASREEEQALAEMPRERPEELLATLRPHIVGSSPASLRGGSIEWKPLALATAAVLVLAALGVHLWQNVWLPAQSRRIASETLETLVELRQATGRIPLRYVTEFERASVTRSGFDETDPSEQMLLQNLRAAVERAPEPEAMLVLGLLSLDEGSLDAAQELLERVLERDPDSVDALNGLAVTYYERANRAPADAYALRQRGLALLRKAQAASPEDLRVLYNFGKFYEALEMPTAAARAYQRYLEKDSSSQWAEEAAYELAQLMAR